MLEYIRGIAEVKSYALAGKYNRQLETALDENAAANIDMELKLQPLMWAQSTVAKLMDVAVAVLSLVLYTTGHMALLNCVMLCLCSFLLTEGLEQAGTQSSLLRVVDSCVNQATDILNLPAMDISGAALTPEHYDLRAEDIRFSYGEKPIINGVTLTIPERTTTAIKNGLTDIMPALCNVDYVSMELIHARLVRTTTCANGCKCDYTICGDRAPYLKAHPEYRDEAGYRRNV